MTAAAASAAVPDLISLADAAAKDAAALVAEARRRVRAKVVAEGRIAPERLEAEQHAAHGLAWLATYAEAIREMAAYARRLSGEGRFGETEDLLVRIGIGEYLDQVFGGIPMSQGEMVRPHALGLSGRDLARYRTDAVETLIETGNTPENRARLVALIRAGQGAPTIGDSGLDDTLEAIRAEMRRFGEAEVAPHAHEWHLANRYIPLSVIEHMAGLGVFGLTIPEEYGGMGLSKVSMCVVSE
ncbi:MAG: acyl-CoA dehydrogenase family protein, partial [Microvirga sp.]